METPNIFLNYWADDSQKVTFQEVITWDLSSETLTALRNELFEQLVSEKIADLFPNIDWSQNRSFEKWEQFAETILLHVSLPENVWKKWISKLESTPEPVIEALQSNLSYLENPFPEFVPPIQTEEDLLSAEVYFVNEKLEDLEESDQEEEGEEIDNNDHINQAEGSKKVFEAVQIMDSPLFKKVESQLVEKLANSISLYQSIHFTKELFESDNQRFQEFIQFVDEEASPNNWKQEIEQQFPSLFQTEPSKALTDLLLLITKKFS